MAISGSGITGSGIDTATIVQQLMQIESRPLTKLQQKEAAYQAKITAMGTLLGSVSGLKTSVTALKDSFILGYKTSVSDTSFLTATASSSAVAGSYNIKVNSLASAHSIATHNNLVFSSLTDAVADFSEAGADATTQRLRIQVGTATSVTVDITSSNNTLQGVRDAINNANAGVKASVVQTGTNAFKLVISSNTTGAANTLKIDIDKDADGNFNETLGPVNETNTTGLSRLAYNSIVNQMTQTQGAADASLSVDGLAVTRSSNIIADVVPGATLNLLKGDLGVQNIQLTVSKDNSSITTRVNAFVKAYNDLNTQIKQLRGTVDVKGTLSGESVLLSLGNAIRGITTATFADNQLSSMGISLDKSGVMSVNTTKLEAALTADSGKVVATLNAMGAAVETNLNAYVTDILPGKQKGMQDTVKSIQKSEERMQVRLEQIQARLQKQYSKLDTLLQQLQGTSNYVTQQMTQIANQFSKK